MNLIRRVELSARATKDLRRVPAQVLDKLELWVRMVEMTGLAEVRRIPGFHDEPLKWNRKGQRSIRLSLLWRAIYEIAKDGSVEFVRVEEVTPHKY